MKPGKRLGPHIGTAIDWVGHRWFKLTIALCALSVAYSTHVFVHRFLAFTWYLFQTMEARGTLS